jgi:hypothetical protein
MTKKIGRPPESVPQDVAEEIVEWISHGKTLRDFCRLEGKPAWRTVYAWMEKDKEFYARIAHARELGHDAIAEEALEIIDTPPEIAETWSQSGGSKHRDSAHVGWLKNRAEMRLKLLAKWNPKKYGDKTMTEVTGADGGAIQIDDTERAAKLQSILAAATARKNGSSV